MRNISQLTLAEVPVPIAPLEDQAVCLDKINQQLAYADRLRTQVRHAADTAIALRRSLLSAAFTGRLVPQDPNDEPAISKFKPIPAPALRSVSIPAGIQEELPL
jgi:type I restriction enzyme S subunit